MPAVAGGADDQGVGAELIGHRGEFPGRVAAPGDQVHVEPGPVADLVKLGEQPENVLAMRGNPREERTPQRDATTSADALGIKAPEME